jgi:hypothetical protein
MNQVKIQIALIMPELRFGTYVAYWSQFVIRPSEASSMKYQTSQNHIGKGLSSDDRASVY